jgi:hypothetical protein
MLPFAITTFFIPAAVKKKTDDGEVPKELSIFKNLIELFTNLRYTCIVLGTGAYTFVIGNFSNFVVPREIFEVSFST